MLISIQTGGLDSGEVVGVLTLRSGKFVGEMGHILEIRCLTRQDTSQTGLQQL